MKTTLNINLKTIIIVVVILLVIFGGGFGWLGKRLDLANDQLSQQIHLTEALQADIAYTKNKLDEEVATKKSLQTDIRTLNDQNLNLTKNQEELLWRVKSVQKDNDLISAALVETQATLDSIRFENTKVTVSKIDTSITFAENNDSISFDITIGKAQPASPLVMPTLTFNSLMIPNKQFIEFHWDDNKEYKQKPISFSISNSNPLMTTINVDSYIIPEVNKNALKPTGWQKVGGFFKNRKVELIVGSIGMAIGIYIGATAF